MSFFIEDAYVKLRLQWAGNSAGSILRGSIEVIPDGRYFVWTQGTKINPHFKFPVIKEFVSDFTQRKAWCQISPLELLALEA